MLRVSEGFKWSHSRWRQLKSWISKTSSHQGNERPILLDKSVTLIRLTEHTEEVTCTGTLYLTTHHMVFLERNQPVSALSRSFVTGNFGSVCESEDTPNSIILVEKEKVKIVFKTSTHAQIWLAILTAFRSASLSVDNLEGFRRRLYYQTKLINKPSDAYKRWDVFNFQTSPAEAAVYKATMLPEMDLNMDDYENISYSTKGIQIGFQSAYPAISSAVVGLVKKVDYGLNFLELYVPREVETIMAAVGVMGLTVIYMLTKYLPLTLLMSLLVIVLAVSTADHKTGKRRVKGKKAKKIMSTYMDTPTQKVRGGKRSLTLRGEDRDVVEEEDDQSEEILEGVEKDEFDEVKAQEEDNDAENLKKALDEAGVDREADDEEEDKAVKSLAKLTAFFDTIHDRIDWRDPKKTMNILHVGLLAFASGYFFNGTAVLIFLSAHLVIVAYKFNPLKFAMEKFLGDDLPDAEDIEK